MAATITDEKYVSLTTYKRDGSAKSVPVWIVDLGDGSCGFTTASSSYKVKRINNDERVILQASDSRGRLVEGSSPISGTATTSTADFERVRAKVQAKYGLTYRAITLMGKVAKLNGRGSGTDTAVIITFD